MTLTFIKTFLIYFNSMFSVYLAWKYQALWNHYMKFSKQINKDMDHLITISNKTLAKLEAKTKKETDGK